MGGGLLRIPRWIVAVQHIYEHAPLTPELVHELNATVEFESLRGDAAEIDYPVAI